jgi:DNA-binding NarL/FixJ family response regulator
MTKGTAILSDQAWCRDSFVELMHRHGLRDVRAFASSAELLQAAHARPPSVLLVDLDHQHEDTMSLVRSLRHALLDTHLVAIGTALRQGATDSTFEAGLETPHGDLAMLLAAAHLRAPARLASAEVKRQHRLWSRVTERQRDVMRWLAVGADNRRIATKLRIGVRAIKAHVSNLLHVFGLQNRTELALLADRAGLFPPSARRATFPLDHG